MKIAESIYEVVVDPSHKILTAGIREENPPRRGLVLRIVRAMPSAENDMKISRWANQKSFSSTARDILQMNVRSWETLELSTLIVGLLSTAGATPYPGKALTGSSKTMTLLITQWMKFY